MVCEVAAASISVFWRDPRSADPLDHITSHGTTTIFIWCCPSQFQRLVTSSHREITHSTWHRRWSTRRLIGPSALAGIAHRGNTDGVRGALSQIIKSRRSAIHRFLVVSGEIVITRLPLRDITGDIVTIRGCPRDSQRIAVAATSFSRYTPVGAPGAVSRASSTRYMRATNEAICSRVTWSVGEYVVRVVPVVTPRAKI